VIKPKSGVTKMTVTATNSRGDLWHQSRHQLTITHLTSGTWH